MVVQLTGTRTFRGIFLLCLSYSLVVAQTDAQILRTFWLGLGGAKYQWQGSNPCITTDFVGLSCSNGIYSIDVSSSITKSYINSSTGVIDPSVGLLGPRLSSLNLNGLGLQGTIPQAVCNLTQLTALSLDSNKLTGQLPACIGSMFSLQTLSVFSNLLYTPIPDLSQLSNLSTLSLGNNVITSHGSFPSSVTSLNLENCRLTSPIMDLLGNMTALQTVSIFTNSLTGNLSGISRYPNITSFNAGLNHITGQFTEEWNQLSNLTSLSLGGNQMTGALPYNTNLSQIILLVLQNNQFNGTVPVSIFTNSPKLQRLWLSNNSFDSIETTPNPYTAPSLNSIQLNDCNITGSFPQLSGNFPSLIYLQIQNNLLTDDVPNYSFSFPVLNQLDISSNNFSGYPQTVNGINSLRILRMNGCNFNPSTLLLSLPNLATLSINNARLTGQTIDVSQLPNLNSLDLSFNSLSSTHSSLITSSVATLSLQKNLFTTVPDLTGMNSIKSLVLYYNQIASVPDYVYNFTSLETLDLGSARLTGPLPPLYRLPKLLKLVLVNNQLTGQISPNFFNSSITWLDLGVNQLSGSLSWPASSSMVYLSLDANALSGVIPSVNGWTSLKTFDIHGNNFSSYASNSLPNLLTNCDMTGSALSCIPPPPCTSDSSKTSARLCGVVNDVTLDVAKGYITAAENSSSLPGLLSELTMALLKKNPNFAIITENVNLTATTLSVANGNALIVSTSAGAASLPTTAFQNQTSVTVVISSIRSNPFSNRDDRAIYGSVVGVSVYQQTTELSVVDSLQRINITVGSRSILPDESNYTCLFWEEVSDSHWDNEGCDLLLTPTSVICSCTHLTNFTVGHRNDSNSGLAVPAKNNPNTTIIIAVVCGSVVVGVISMIIIVIVIRKRAPRKSVIFESSGDSDKIDFTELIRSNGRTELWRGVYGGTSTVAIKKSVQSKHVQELFAEATTLKELHHPNIVMFMNQYFNETSSYFVMEYMDGGDLQRYLTKCSLSVPNILSIANQIAKAMTYVSDSGLVHTRLSTNKILLSELSGDEWKVKICGWSKCTNEEQPTIEANCGFYTAPEALNDRVQRSASDVYSFGLLLWTIMKEGKQFLYGKTHKELMHIIRDGVIPPIEDQWDSHISSTIVSCTVSNWADRPSFRILTTRLERTSQSDVTMQTQHALNGSKVKATMR